MSFVLLIIGTILTALFIFFLNKGAKYAYLFENLTGNDFPFPDIYCAGMVMQEHAVFKLPGRLKRYLGENVQLVYTRRFREYYIHVIWSQALSFGLLCMAICCVFGAMMPDMEFLMLIVAIVMAVAPGYVFISNVADKVKVRREACEKEFPNAISKIALLVNSGVIIHDAWEMVANGNEGVFYSIMKQSCDEMKNGKSDVAAILEFGEITNSEDIKKFTSALAQSIERGGGELPMFLRNQSSELWAHHKQFMLQKGEKAAGALIMPIAVMFAGIMMIVVVAAMQSFGV